MLSEWRDDGVPRRAIGERSHYFYALEIVSMICRVSGMAGSMDEVIQVYNIKFVALPSCLRHNIGNILKYMQNGTILIKNL